MASTINRTKNILIFGVPSAETLVEIFDGEVSPDLRAIREVLNFIGCPDIQISGLRRFNSPEPIKVFLLSFEDRNIVLERFSDFECDKVLCKLLSTKISIAPDLDKDDREWIAKENRAASIKIEGIPEEDTLDHCWAIDKTSLIPVRNKLTKLAVKKILIYLEYPLPDVFKIQRLEHLNQEAPRAVRLFLDELPQADVELILGRSVWLKQYKPPFDTPGQASPTLILLSRVQSKEEAKETRKQLTEVSAKSIMIDGIPEEKFLTGINEKNPDLITTDPLDPICKTYEAVHDVLRFLELPYLFVEAISRMGDVRLATRKPRPVKVCLNSQNMRNRVIEKASMLDDYTPNFCRRAQLGSFKKIVIKPDKHYLSETSSKPKRQEEPRKDVSQLVVEASNGGEMLMRLSAASADPFADDEGQLGGGSDGYIHIRIQQRNGRKTLTTVQGINSEFDLKKIVRVAKKEFACNGTVVDHPEYGEVIQLQGDQRQHISGFLKKVGLAREEQIKVHGF